MKKLFAVLAVFTVLTLNVNPVLFAQPEDNTEVVDTTGAEGDSTDAVVADPEPEPEPEPTPEPEPEVVPEEASFHQVIRDQFVAGGAGFMGIVLVCLILGLAFAIERIISLNLATTNTRKLLEDVEAQVKANNIEGAKEICKGTRGPVASIFYQGLDRVHEGKDIVEKSIVSYGSVQMGLLEKGMIWLALFIALAPMLGFMGTVIGMIEAFDAIAELGDINISVVAVGIKVALLTTVFGLITAIILQIFYNYIVSKVDGLVNDMEDASISFMDILVKNNVVKD